MGISCGGGGGGSNPSPQPGGTTSNPVYFYGTYIDLVMQDSYDSQVSETFDAIPYDSQFNYTADTISWTISSSDTHATLPSSPSISSGGTRTFDVTFNSVIGASPTVDLTVAGIDTSNSNFDMGSITGSGYLWFSNITASLENMALTGDVSCAQAIGLAGWSPATHTNVAFCALPGSPSTSGMCQQNLQIYCYSTQASAQSPVFDEGPFFGIPAYGSCPAIFDPYWQTGTRPMAETNSCTSSDAALDLSGATATALGISGNTAVAWRFVGTTASFP